MILTSGSPSTYSIANQQLSPCFPAPQMATRLEWCSPTAGLHDLHEPPEVLLVLRDLAIEHLEGGLLASSGVAGLVDHARAAPGQQRPQLVVRDRLAGEYRFLRPDGREGTPTSAASSNFWVSAITEVYSFIRLLPISNSSPCFRACSWIFCAADERPVDAVQVGQQEPSRREAAARNGAERRPYPSVVCSYFSPRPIESDVPSTRLKMRP